MYMDILVEKGVYIQGIRGTKIQITVNIIMLGFAGGRHRSAGPRAQLRPKAFGIDNQ